jgi:hypothetical protein
MLRISKALQKQICWQCACRQFTAARRAGTKAGHSVRRSQQRSAVEPAAASMSAEYEQKDLRTHIEMLGDTQNWRQVPNKQSKCIAKPRKL